MGGWQALIISNMALFAWVASFGQQLISMIRSARCMGHSVRATGVAND